MKKFLALLLSILMLASLVACGQGSTGSSVSTAAGGGSTAAGDVVEITYAFWGGEDEAKSTQATLDVFNSSQDAIHVTAMPIPWETYMEKLNTMATAGELPDTAIMSEAGVIQWAEQGMLLDISDMYAEGEAKPLDSLAFTYEGSPVAYSAANEILMMFYNKDMFDAADVAYPPNHADDAWTWDEFVDVAKQLTLDANGNTPNDAGFDKDNIVQYGCMVENLTWQLEVWCLSNGSGFYSADGSSVTINDPAAMEAIQQIADLYLVHHVAPLSTGQTDDGVPRSLVAGTVAMTTNGAWNMGTCLSSARDDDGLNYGVGVLPYMQKKVTINTGGPNVVFSQTKHPAEAMEFLKWYAKEDNNWDGLISTGIWMPTLDAYYTDEALTKKWLENPAFPPYDECKPVLADYTAEYSQPASWYYVNNTNDFNDLLGSVLGDVWTGKTTVEQAVTDNYDALVSAHDGNG